MESPDTLDPTGPGPARAPGYAHVTGDVAPVEFRFKETPEDFVVEELPLYPPSGEGTHLFVTIEKTGLSTMDAIRRIARALNRRESDIGYAGRKDAAAVTRQTLSVEHVDPEALARLSVPGVRVLSVARHPHKLRVGHLIGNRFALTLRGVSEADHARIGAVLATLERTGVPNYYGAQRFGRSGRTHELGRLLVQRRLRDYLVELAAQGPDGPFVDELRAALAADTAGAHRKLAGLAGRLPAELAAVARQLARRPGDVASATRAVPRRAKQLHVSALQAYVFNSVLALRIREGAGLGALAEGDVAYVHDGGAAFLVTEDADERELAARLARFAISPSGPIPGARMLRAGGRTAESEAAALAAAGVTLADFGRIGPGLNQGGARRPLRVPLAGLVARWSAGSTHLAFTLPKGAYATVLLEELRKDHLRP